MSRFPSGGGGFGGLGTSSSTTLSYITPPPDLSRLPADIVVQFKNLLKKDSTTKSKALEEIVVYVETLPSKDGRVEDSVLDAWADLYPRVSIDNSRRVRELSHIVLRELFKSARKSLVKRLPRLIGAWFGGTCDKEKVVSRAANDGMSEFLGTEERKLALWSKAQKNIMDYAIEAISETPDTLTDPRTCTKEDSEAKYYRVAASSLYLVLNLMEKTDIQNIEDQIDRYLGMESVWSLATADEYFARRMLYQLLQTCLDKKPDLLKPRFLRAAKSAYRQGRVLNTDCLKSSQAGTAKDLAILLTNLTEVFPEIWAIKKHPLQQLQPFVEKGSQGSSRAYWEELWNLLSVLPGEAPSEELAASFLASLRRGVSHREEPRENGLLAWCCYINTFERFASGFTPDRAFLQQHIFPLTQQYLYPTPQFSTWIPPVPPRLLPKAWRIVAYHTDASVQRCADEEWRRLRDSFCSRLSNSLPEVSKEYQESQQAIAAEGDRWFTLVAMILSHGPQTENQPEVTDNNRHLDTIVTSCSVALLQAARDLLLKRNYKPFGAAALLQSALKKCPDSCIDGDLLFSLFSLNDPEKIKILVESPSLQYLVSCLDKAANIQPDRFKEIWNSLIQSALESSAMVSQTAVKLLLSISSATGPASKNASLQKFLGSIMRACAKGNPSSSWELCETAIKWAVVDETLLQSLAEDIIRDLVSVDTAPALKVLYLIKLNRPTLLSSDSDLYIQLLAKLLALAEISAHVGSETATILQKFLDQASTGEVSNVKIVQSNLDDAELSSLSVEILLQQASKALSSGSVPVEELVPNTNVWMGEISPLLEEIPDPSLSLTNNLGGAYLLVKPTVTSAKVKAKRDKTGRSIPARMALYTSKLLSSHMQLSSLPIELQVELIYLLYLTIELAGDQLTLMGVNGLWSCVGTDEIAAEMQQLITQSRKIINDTVTNDTDWKGADLTGQSFIERLINLMLPRTADFSPRALYNAKALGSLFETLVDAQGPPAKLEEWLVKSGVMKPYKDTAFAAMAFFTGFGQVLARSDSVNILCTRMVSNMIGAYPGLETTLVFLVLLDGCMSVYEAGKVPVENRKQVIAFKQITSWLDTPDEMSPRLAAETCKVLERVFPNVKQAYGPYWEQITTYCIRLWTKAALDLANIRVPYLYSSIKLISALENTDDPNDDLAEALATHAKEKSRALVALLKLPRETPTTQPCQIVDMLLCRAVEKVPLEHLDGVILADLYGVVASESRTMQTAAFGLLHRALPAAQAQIAVDSLLEKKDARLPDELLSLLLDAPTLEDYPEELLVQFPTPVRGYLLAWHLIFDAYSKAPQKLRGDYTQCLKSEKYVEPLLYFMFDVLGHSAAHPLNLDKEGLTQDHIQDYDIKVADSEEEERNMHWLLVHLFYKALKYIPGLCKAWYLDARSRSKQTAVAVESWTTKYFAPLVISEALDDVNEWMATQETTEPDTKELELRVSKTAREVTAAYEIDEDAASIVIRIPTSYPLGNVEVVGLKRVAVDEKKWQSWIMITQGAIQFANGSIVDGLAVFRRNIIGALKNQTECAICYSIVSTDKKLPDKECPTCGHFFHRYCLYKWFTNSGHNTCPLCRKNIPYLGAETRSGRKTTPG
ncbi:hypothetical protein B0H66DRAFT_640071 [Apodospora peruviana]|uniref:E3 ubiquitin-protein ligase listerin n=1 Tax=Apodospora peruviana TaxID=516989 RepID=A0AAE0M4G7_9PEZI|nr:hypothetical protein B0H66DRAFT_640071 [Apodospora peruviana]